MALFGPLSKPFPLRLIRKNPAIIIFLGEIARGSFVDHDRATGMKLEGAGGDHAGDRTLDRFGDDFGFAGAGRQHDAAAAIEDCADTHGDGPARNRGFTSERFGILFAGGGCEGFDARARAQGGKRFVEADVSGLADAQELEVDAAGFLNEGFVSAAFGFEVVGDAIWQMCFFNIDVHAAKQVLAHVFMVGMRIGRSEADVFIEVEGHAFRKIKFLVRVQPRQLAIDALHRFAGSQTEHEPRVRSEVMGDDPGDERGGGCFGALNDNFHAPGVCVRRCSFQGVIQAGNEGIGGSMDCWIRGLVDWGIGGLMGTVAVVGHCFRERASSPRPSPPEEERRNPPHLCLAEQSGSSPLTLPSPCPLPCSPWG
jgi:hypothetical protein